MRTHADRQNQTLEPWARLTVVPGGVALESSYDARLVAELKARIPATDRQWDGANRRWIVTAPYATVLPGLIKQILGLDVALPADLATQTRTSAETRLLKLEYLGRCRLRGDESSALGWVNGSWSTIWPEAVLRAWFQADPDPARPDEKPTLYATLGVARNADDQTIRAAYRRLAKAWHPDVCREPDAIETFKAIQAAYAVLSHPATRKKYDAGLYFEEQAKAQAKAQARADQARAEFLANADAQGYRTPLRCGWVLAEGTERLGRFVVAKILEWQDIVDQASRVMVTSWPAGADHFTVEWVEA